MKVVFECWLISPLHRPESNLFTVFNFTAKLLFSQSFRDLNVVNISTTRNQFVYFIIIFINCICLHFDTVPHKPILFRMLQEFNWSAYLCPTIRRYSHEFVSLALFLKPLVKVRWGYSLCGQVDRIIDVYVYAYTMLPQPTIRRRSCAVYRQIPRYYHTVLTKL